MNNTILDARTVSIVRELTVEQRTGANGSFEAKSILFRIAVDRDYKVTRTENGKTITESPTDFWLAKATGQVAQAINDFCTAKKEDGKLVSRRLLLSGNFENYQSTRMVKRHVCIPNVNINGGIFNVEDDVEIEERTTNTIFIIDSFRFLDRKPEAPQAATPVAASTGAPVATPVAMPVMAQPVAVAPQAAVVAPQAAVAQTAAPVADPAMTAAVAAMGQVAAQQMAIQPPVQQVVTPAGVPTISPGFAPNGETAPF